MVVAEDRQVVDAVIVVIAVDVVRFQPCGRTTSDAVIGVLALMVGAYKSAVTFPSIERR